MSAETRTTRWAPETDPQWGPRHLDSHREKTTGTSWALTIWLCCSWNKLLVRLDRELVPRLSLVSHKVFFSILSRWSFGSLPLSPLACLVGDTSFPAISSTWLHRHYVTELDDAITEFNNEMSLTENWVFNLVILHYWHGFPILILCSCFDKICIVKSTIEIKVTWLTVACKHEIQHLLKKNFFLLPIRADDISNISDNAAIIMTTMSNFKISWLSNISNSSILSPKERAASNVQYYVPLSITVQETWGSFHSCGCQISIVQIPESEIPCYKDTFSARCLVYLKQSGNHKHVLAPHSGSATADDLKSQTNKLEFNI